MFLNYDMLHRSLVVCLLSYFCKVFNIYLMFLCRYLLCGQDVTGEAYQISTYSRRSSSDSYTGGSVVSCTPAQSDFTKTLASKTVQVSLSLMFTLIFFLSASLYFSKRGAYWDRLCRDVVGRWSLVGWLSRACTGQTVHSRPIVTMEH